MWHIKYKDIACLRRDSVYGLWDTLYMIGSYIIHGYWSLPWQLPTIFLYDVLQIVCGERGFVDEANLPFAKLCVCVCVCQ